MNKQLQDPLKNLVLQILYMLKDIPHPLGTPSGNMDVIFENAWHLNGAVLKNTLNT